MVVERVQRDPAFAKALMDNLAVGVVRRQLGVEVQARAVEAA